MRGRTLKKAVALCLAVCLVAGLVPVTAQAAEGTGTAPVTGACGDNITWSLDLDTGEMTVSGTGYVREQPGSDYKDSITSVVYGEGILGLENAHTEYRSLKRVVLPDGLLRIGERTFYNCVELEEVRLPDSLVSIGDDAFYDCGLASQLKLPHSLVQLGWRPFCYLPKEELTIPYGVSIADEDALTAVRVANFYVEPDNPLFTAVDGVLFSKDMKTLIKYPTENPRTSYAIPEGVVTARGILDCPEEELSFPSTFTGFEDFVGPSQLDAKRYTVAEGNPAFSAVDGVLFNKDGTTLIRYPSGCTDTSYQIPDGVTTLGPYAFDGASSLTSMTIPASVTELAPEGDLFTPPYHLTDIYYGGTPLQWRRLNPTRPGMTEWWANIQMHYGSEPTTFTVTYDPGEGTEGTPMPADQAEAGEAVTFPDTNIYYSPAEGKRFKGWEIDGTEYLPGMTYTISADVTAVAVWEDSSIPSGRCGENIDWSFDAATGTLTVSGTGDMVFPSRGCDPWLEMRPSITRVVVGEGITRLGNKAFQDCTALTTVELPQSLTCIGAYAFSGCAALEEVTIPDSVTRIEECAFAQCGKLRQAVLPAGVTYVGYRCFDACGSLTSMVLPASIRYIDFRETFQNCTSMESLVLEPGGEAGNVLGFSPYSCPAIKSAVVPSSVGTSCSFTFCDALTTVTVEEGIKEATFGSCPSLTTVYLPESIKVARFVDESFPETIYYAGSRIQWEAVTCNRDIPESAFNEQVHWDEAPVQYAKADVTYDRNGGTDGMPMMFVEKNTSITLPACRFVPPEGKVFRAWEVNGQEHQPGEAVLIGDDTVLKALWEDAPVTTVAKGTYMDENGVTQSYEVTFDTPLPAEGGTLAPGNYFLPGDITLTENITIQSGTVRLDLAGHILRGNGAGTVITVGENGELEIYDSDANPDNGTPTTHYYTKSTTDHLWMFDDASTDGALAVTGGVITGGDAESPESENSGCGVFLMKNAKLTLLNGRISGNCARNATNLDSIGGGVSGEEGAFTMAGGEISGNVGQGGVKVGNLIMTGGVITGSGTGIFVIDTVTMLGGRVQDNDYAGLRVAMRKYNTRTILQGGTISGSTYGIIPSSSSGSIEMNGGEISGCNYGVYLDSSIPFVMNGGTICGNNSGVQMSSINQGAPSFTMNGGKISDNSTGIAAEGEVAPQATMTNGEITNNGNGVYLKYGTFVMENGMIYGNENSYGGPGVTVSGGNASNGHRAGTFVMNGGKITNNRQTFQQMNHGGGGVFVTEGSSFTMNGGEISSNYSEGCGGGVFVDASATFTLNDGLICNNETNYDSRVWGGGGVYVHGQSSSSAFVMNGGEIRDNISGGCGGGILAYGYGTDGMAVLTVTGGKITGNQAAGSKTDQTSGCGGGIFAYGGYDVSISGGEISGNRANTRGGGLHWTSGTIELSGDVLITGNTANLTNPVDQNAFLDGGTVSVPDVLTNSEKIGITMSSPGVFTQHWSEHMTAAPADYFVSEQDGYAVTAVTTSDGVAEAALMPTHTATFVADGVTVDAVKFAEGDASLVEPEVPAKAHFDGVWAAYDLASATADITVNAVYTQNEDHSGSETSVVTAPTCEEAGYTTYTCSVCGNVRQADEVAALGHDYQKDDAQSVPAQPGVDGYDLYVCSRDPAHTYWETIPALPCIFTATFVADGVTVDTVTFTEGAASLVEPEVPAKAHFDGVWAAYDLAAATSDITVNAVYTQNSDHSGSETSAVTAPTCETAGYTTYTCSVCGNERRTDETAALGHDYHKDEAESVPAQPGVDGYDLYVCSRDPSHFYKVPVAMPIVTHTATFVIGDEVIGSVVFEEGSATLEEPAMPERANYVGHWDFYDLAVATTDITVEGHYTPVEPDKVSEMEGEAEAEYKNGVVDIRLTARAASRTIKVTSKKTKPVDVVLVLDQSGSMEERLSQWDRRSKRDALVSCANDFVQELYENAVDTGADHRVAVVGFAYSAYNRGNYQNTGLLATPGGKSIRYSSIKGSDYASALLPINDGGKINGNVVSGIDSIVAEGATAADVGLKMARNIFAETPVQGERERIVIFITDGTPTSWGEDAQLVRQTAADAISVANAIKNGQGAKIYSIGVHANADPAASFTSSKDGVSTDWWGNFVSYDFNRFLHAISSNYPDAKAMDALGQGSQESGFYMGVRDTGNLGNIFTNILYSTVYQLKTFDKVTFSYTLSKEFTLTMEQELEMRRQLKESLGLTDMDIQVERNADGTTTLRFQNVKTKELYDESGALCYEAALRFQVSANQLAQGDVVTGAGAPGAGYEDSAMTPITPPTVTIPQERKLIVFTINGQVYRIQEAALGDEIVVPETELAQWTVEDGAVVTEDYVVFEAAPDEGTQYTICWIIDGERTVVRYPVGAPVTLPEVPAKDGYDFTGWSRSVPGTMPAYDLVCEAIYSPAHVHSFEKAYQSGKCREGIVTTYRCACGEVRTETAEPAEHNFTAVLSETGVSGNTVERVVCTKCGHSEEQNISFKVSYSERWQTTVLDLSLYQNEVNVTVPDEEIEMRFYIGDEADGKTYTVTRIDADGQRTRYRAQAENGYLVFRANHFSVYVLSEVAEEQQAPAVEVSYEDATGILDSKEDVVLPAENKPESGAAQPVVIKPAAPSKQEPVSAATPVTERFDDVEAEAWYVEAVQFAVDEGLLNGTSDTTFAPEMDTNRAMIVTILWRLQGSPVVNYALELADVADDAWYAEAVRWAASEGIVQGYDNGTFGAEDAITREQLATMLYRYEQKYGGGGFTGMWMFLLDFQDADRVSEWANEAIHWMTMKKVITGKGDKVLDPQGNATRAEAAVMIQRYIQLAEK